MCGIVGAIANRNISVTLLECLRRLEYRGYDSAGIVVFNPNTGLQRLRAAGKIDILGHELESTPLVGSIGIAHTRWATHGEPTENNAHPHISRGTIALVHNGIIENFQEIREKLKMKGYQFHTETDTEVIAHSIHSFCSEGADFLTAVHKTVKELKGAFALAIMHRDYPEKIIAVRSGSPLVIGFGDNENFLASDSLALLPITNKFVYLEEGDIAEIERANVNIYNADLQKVTRSIKISNIKQDAADIGKWNHFMQKEIFEQPAALSDCIEGRLSNLGVFVESFGNHAKEIFNKINKLQIVACGSSYHAALVGKYWLEKIARISCQVEVASEARSRTPVVESNTLFVSISQSGETADTLAALRQAKNLPYVGTLAICNVPESSLVRESDLVFMTRAGIEVGVATTKAFSTQLVGLLFLALALKKTFNPKTELEHEFIKQLKHLPSIIKHVLSLDQQIKSLAERFTDKQHAFFLGRGANYPIAMEGALKMKEISYIHAESYPAGELKHGPLALIDKNMLIVVIAPNDELIEKLKSNLHEVRARNGELIIFTDESTGINAQSGWSVLKLPKISPEIAPIVYNIPLQLLAYHAAVFKGTDVDRPRNLAKSVTVE